MLATCNISIASILSCAVFLQKIIMYFSIVLQGCKPLNSLPTLQYFKALIIILSILSNCAVTTLVTAQIGVFIFSP